MPSNTPKTDAFAPSVIIILNDADFISVEAAVRTEVAIRNALIQWAEFARSLEAGAVQ
jgi:hypothetical protein